MKRADAPASILVFDTETTGTNIESDRILTCYAMLQDIKGKVLKDWSWTIDPGVPVDPKSSEIHGMTTAWIQENGRKDVREAIREIYTVLMDAVEARTPIVAFNLPFDLSLLDREVLRHVDSIHGVEKIVENGLFFDGLVFDRATDKYRKGKRKLMDVARHLGVELDESRLHEAQYDVEVTGKVTWRLFQKSKWTVEQLQPMLKDWKRGQAISLQKHFADTGKTNEDGSAIIIETGFPYNPKPLW